MRHMALLTVLSLAAAGCTKEDPPTPASTGMPAGHPTGEAALPDLPSGDISGTLQVSPEMADKVATGDVVFVMARNSVTGSLLAVTRVQVDALPASFTLTGGTAMHGGSALAGKVRVEARVDKDGDAMTKEPGDVVGEVDGLVAVPADGVVLTLTKTL
jgi:hypothetical protein